MRLSRATDLLRSPSNGGPVVRDPAVRPAWRESLWPALFIIAAVALVYWNSVGAPFLYDDMLAIPQNPSIRQLWPVWDVLMPQGNGLTVSGRPVLNLSFAINYAVSGSSPWSYHVLNLLIHATCGLLLYGTVRRTWRQPTVIGRTNPTVLALNPKTAAMAIALLWVLHPLNTQAVTYTVQRAESLMALFYLLTVYAFVRGVDRGASQPSPRGWMAVSLIACVLGMATKEVMATAPLIVLLYDRTFVAGSFAAALRERWRYYLGLAGTWLLLAALVLSTGGNRGGTVGIGTGVAWWSYGLTQFEAIWRYLALSVWPAPLIFEYGTFWVQDAADIVPYAGVVVPLIAGTVYALYRAPVLGFLGTWFFLILAPTSLTPGTIQMIVEHRMYLPLAAVTVLFVIGVSQALRRASTVVLGLIAVVLGGLTLARNHDYRSHLALWSDTVAKRPDNARAYLGLGEALEEAGRMEEAIQVRKKGLQLDPTDARSFFNLGNALALAGRVEEAIEQFETSLRMNAKDASVHNNLALALAKAGRLQAALHHYRAAIALSPNAAYVHFNCGVALMRVRDEAAAITEFETALRLQPTNADAHFNLGTALIHLRRFDEAVTHFAEAFRLKPADAEFRSTLARAHAEAGDRLLESGGVSDAVRHFEASVQLAPSDAIVHHNLGIAHARLEHWVEAQREFETALRLKPDYAQARQHLQQVQSVLEN